MCGFSGIVDFEKKEDLQGNLNLSLDIINHRGPDHKGCFFDKNNGIYFGFNRLKILDLLDRSNQPFIDDSGDIVLMFNGEIYNYKEIKKELESSFDFKTTSDTEVLLYAYKKWGVKFLEKIEGMFAIAIYDKNNDEIILIRDRMGIKPLFYFFDQNHLVFGSEIKSLLNSGLIDKKINPFAISSYLTFLCVIDNYTPFLNVFKLRPGELMVVSLKNKIVKKEFYWDLKNNMQKESETDALKNVFDLINQSIKEQMQSDVDFGCFLSGGLDSSINAILMSKHLGKPVKSLSVYFNDEKYNEIKYSRMVAEKLNAEKIEKQITQKDFWIFLEKFGKINDSLNGDLVCFPLYFLSELTQENDIKMIQVGEGADEIFCGYRSFKYFWLIKLIDSFWSKTIDLNQKIKCFFAFILKPFTFANPAIGEALRRWKNGLPWYFGANNIFSNEEKNKLINFNLNNAASDKKIDEIIKKNTDYSMSPLQKISYMETKLRLPELLLNRVDLITMQFSIESRVPFLNSKLVEYAFNLQDDLKLKNGTTKYLLKNAFKGAVPEEVIKRKKQGFWAPFFDWYTGDKDFNFKIKEIILNSRIIDDGILERKSLEKILNNKKINEKNILKIWSVLILTKFYENYFA